MPHQNAPIALNPASMSVDHAGLPPQFARDDELEVTFRKDQRLHKHLDQTTGIETPHLVEIDVVDIKFPADPTKNVVEEVKPDSTYIRRFPHQWKAYQAGQTNQSPGTPIDSIGLFNPMELATLQLAGYKTVEQLLGAPFHVVSRMGPGSGEFKTRLERWHTAQTDNDSLRSQLLAMQEQMKAMQAQLAAERSAPVKKAG